MLAALGSYQIDLLRFWLGDIVTVAGTAETYVKERPRNGGRSRVTTDDLTTFLLKFTSGSVATVVLSSVAAVPEGTRVRIRGDEGTLRLDTQERLWGREEGRAGANLPSRKH